MRKKIINTLAIIFFTLSSVLILSGCASYGPYEAYSSGHYYYYNSLRYDNFVGWYPGDPYAGTVLDFNGF